MLQNPTTYNHLNLPTKIIFGTDDERYISYLYNAHGKKVAKVVDDKSVSSPLSRVTNYLSGFQYNDGKLDFFPTAEGYVSVNGTSYNYVYNYTDHLGNIRLSYSLEGPELKILEENHYYPFGMKHSYNPSIKRWGKNEEGQIFAILTPVLRTSYQYKYNGKEFQDEFGLGVYDYGARNYDPVIGRWMNIDPLSEFMRSTSPYGYAFNNPVYFSDSEGLIPIPVPSLYKNMKWRIDSWFGPRNFSGGSKFHRGLDINFGYGDDDYGAPVLATHDGTVVSIKSTNSGGGRLITIQSPDGSFQTQYLHLSSIAVSAGQEVNEGQTIGLIGGSGRGKEKGYQVHLHYQIKKYEKSTGTYQHYDPTEGRGKNSGYVVDPQSWINTSNSNPFFTQSFDKPYSSGFNFNLDLPIIKIPFFPNSSSSSTRASVSPISPITPAPITPMPLPSPTPGPNPSPSPSPMPAPNPAPVNIPNFLPNRLN